MNGLRALYSSVNSGVMFCSLSQSIVCATLIVNKPFGRFVLTELDGILNPINACGTAISPTQALVKPRL